MSSEVGGRRRILDATFACARARPDFSMAEVAAGAGLSRQAVYLHFLDRAAEDGLPRKQIDKGAVAVLEAYDWPGNVRELENLMRRIAALSRDEWIDADGMRRALGEAGTAQPATRDPGIEAAVRARLERIAIEEPHALDNGTLYDRIISEVERPLIEAVLARHGNNQLRAARSMGINRNTLRKRLDTLGIASVRPEGAE